MAVPEIGLNVMKVGVKIQCELRCLRHALNSLNSPLRNTRYMIYYNGFSPSTYSFPFVWTIAASP